MRLHSDRVIDLEDVPSRGHRQNQSFVAVIFADAGKKAHVFRGGRRRYTSVAANVNGWLKANHPDHRVIMRRLSEEEFAVWIEKR